ncbi:MAG: TatD family hydrolase [Flavobacteriaceae bacterium]|nr:TatD family hydrolase [Flavobacteriaceae bacterium]
MKLVDTHTHLYSDQFDDDRAEVVQRALDSGIETFYIPAIDSSQNEAMFALEKQFPDSMRLMTGLHPTHAKDDYKKELSIIEDLLAKREFCAIGEIGMDLYWDKQYIEQQRDAFVQQILLAKKYKLPIAIHCREAFDEVFEVLEEHKGDDLYGVFHCFTGTLEQANLAISYNLKLGIGGVVTFKNGKIDKFLDQIPLSEIVLETDAPYLAPSPFRGKRNESSYVQLIAEKLSFIYDLPLEEIAKITTQNATDIFGK